MVATRMARIQGRLLAASYPSAEALPVALEEPMQVKTTRLLLSAHRLIFNTDGANDESSIRQSSNHPEQKGTDPNDRDASSSKEQDTTTRGVDDEDDVSDPESEFGMMMDIRDATLRPLHTEGKAPLRERIKKAPTRVIQHMAYTRLMEDRMADLERRLQRIERQPETVAPPPGRVNAPTDLILGLKRMSFQEYLPTNPNPGVKDVVIRADHKPRHEFPGQLPYHLIDVVFGATYQHERPSKDHGTKLAADPPDLAANSLAIPAQEPTTNDGQFIQPERIRINSFLLLNVIGDITDCTFSCNVPPNPGVPELLDQVVLRPFKLFMNSETEIRDRIDELENLHMHNGNTIKAEAPETVKSEEQVPPSQSITDSLHEIPESPTWDHSVGLEDNKTLDTTRDVSVDGKNDNIKSLKSFRCLEELRVMREVLDKDLKPTFDLRKQIKDGVARSIAFQDLWHLFPIGGEIVSNDSNGQNQVYRILHVSGGRPFLCERYQTGMDPWNSASDGRDVPKFEILSYFYNSDGKELGACQQLHTIKAYDGNKVITSLPCFPIIYSKNSRGLEPRDFFIERGKRYIELTRKTDIVHKRYDGLTLAMDELREEVRPILNDARRWLMFIQSG